MKIPNTTHGPVTLSKIDYVPRLSQETLAFTAEIAVTVDGRTLRAPVQNDGRGGPNVIHSREVADAIKAYTLTLPPCPVEWDCMEPLPYTTDFLISEMLGKAVAAFETAREHKKMVKKGFTHYTRVGNRTVYSVGVPSKATLTHSLGADAEQAVTTQISV